MGITRLQRIQALANTYADYLEILGQLLDEWNALGERESLPLTAAIERPGRVIVEFVGERFLVELTLEAPQDRFMQHRGLFTFSRVRNTLLDRRTPIARLRINTNPSIVDGAPPGFDGATPTEANVASAILLHWLCVAVDALPPPTID